MRACKVCAKTLVPVISFGKMPMANGFIEDVCEEEFFFDLELFFCPACFMVQLGETLRPEVMFHDHYPFLSSSSRFMQEHFYGIAEEIVECIRGRPDPFVVELGCNDGVLLQHLASRRIRHLGIEPASNVAALARQKGVKVLERFFNVETARQIIASEGKADVLCGSNVLCHVEDIHAVFEGISLLLKEDGIFFFEDPYFLDILRQTSFDQIYDEHVYYFSGLSIANFAEQYGLVLIAMRPQAVHGGSMRYYLKPKGKALVSRSVRQWIETEQEFQLDCLEGYTAFKEKVDTIIRELIQTLDGIWESGGSVAGYGATSKSTTLLNYARIGPDRVRYISDTTPTKIHKYSPGMHIPVKPYDYFCKEPPSHVLLLAWNHKEEILEKEKAYRKQGGKFITFFPKVVVA